MGDATSAEIQILSRRSAKLIAGIPSRRREVCTRPKSPPDQVQWGFMPERSTIDAIFIARQVMEKYREKRKPCYLSFLDLEKAYDGLSRAVL
ncbi:unnamed protein product [Heligmosomoides polygyrus]|uniref:Reverse transcriptase domain-containing protein n=1 Tax=Heligmosomoides polygyrus TaxID=6339 RepID=A0A183F2Z9_HELPZ|nr:unnamed protein product [Heligmosomoides polygyrus]